MNMLIGIKREHTIECKCAGTLSLVVWPKHLESSINVSPRIGPYSLEKH
jgi:hypothetical protein